MLATGKTVIDMTRDADNDNPIRAAAREQAQQEVQSWQGLSQGNAALADQPVPDALDQVPELDDQQQIAPDESEQQTAEAVGPPDLPQADIARPSEDQSVRSIPNTNAIPISALGIAVPQRPIPAEPQVGLQVRAPSAPARPRRKPADLGRQGSEHLFNLPPRPARQQAEPSPMEKAINVKPRTPLTSQPGFVAGLVAALVSGGFMYGYLSFLP